MALTKIDDRGLKTPIDLLDDEKIRLGTGNDLEIYHSGSQSIIDDVGSGALVIRSNNAVDIKDSDNVMMAAFNKDADVKLYYDGSEKFRTQSGGVQVFGNLQLDDGNVLNLGTSSDLSLQHDGNNSYIATGGVGSLYIRTSTSDNAIKCVKDGGIELYYDNSKKFKTSANGINLDNSGGTTGFGKITFGNSGQQYIEAKDSGNFGSGAYVTIGSGTDVAIKAKHDNAVELYYDNSKKFETNSDGAKVTGKLEADSSGSNYPITVSGSEAAKILLTGANNPYIQWQEGTTNKAYAYWDHSNNWFELKNEETASKIHIGASTDIYHGASRKITTIATGAQVDGYLGINEASPDAGIHLTSANDRACIRLENTYDTPDNVWELQPGISGVSNTGFCIYDVTDSANRLVIDGSGKVGIGTSSPSSGCQLTIATGGLNITGQNTTHGVNSLRIGEEGSGKAQLRAYGSDSSSYGSLEINLSASDGSGSNNVMEFKKASQGASLCFPSGGGIIARGADASTYGELSVEVAASDLSGSNNVATFKKLAGGIALAFPSGGGIDFSANSSAGGMSSELLDDYEEGTWTPNFQNVGVTTYGHQSGRYTKVGRFVYCVGQITIDAGLDTTDGSAVNIGGLPFSGDTSHGSAHMTLGQYTSILTQSSYDAFNNVRFGGNWAMLYKGNNSDINYTGCNATGTLQFAISYAL